MDLLSKSRKKTIKLEEFDHTLTTKLVFAVQSHLLLEDLEEPRKKEIEKDTITSARYLFRNFLKITIENGDNLELPIAFNLDRLNEIYQKSDFDWTDQSKFYEFRDWYILANQESFRKSMVATNL